LNIQQLYKKAKKREINSDWLCNEIEKYSESYFLKTGGRVPNLTLERLADILFYLIEKEDQDREREKLKSKTREDWLKLEILKSESSPNQYQSIVSKIERYFELGMISENERDKLKSKFRKCKHFKCENAVINEFGSSYCSLQCRNDENNSKRRLKQTKTRLIMGEYIPKLSRSKEREYRRHEKLILDEIKIKYINRERFGR